MRGALALALASLVSGCAHAPRAVVGEGWGASREAALRAAQRDAVERAAGVALSARTRVENGALAESRVTARAQGRVTKYEVLSETGESGLEKVRIRAVVDPAGLAPAPELSVRVALTGQFADRAAAGLSESLRKKGFSVIGVGNADGADVLVTGVVDAEPLGRIEELASARATLALQAVERGSGRVLFEGSPSASAVDPSPRAALGKACARAGEAGALTLSRALIDRAD